VSRDLKARAWDVETGERLFEVALERTPRAIAFSPDGGAIAIAGEAGAALHDPASGAVRIALGTHRAKAVAYAPSGELVATACDDGAVRLWRAADGSLLDTLAAHDQGAQCLAFSPDGKRLATGGADDRLALWDVATRALVLSREVRDVYCVAWSRDGARLWVLPLAKRAICLEAR
jgi:WD40 repeat protein